MQGYQLTFFTQQNRKHGGFPISEWLIREARSLGISGATLIAASEGFGRHGKLHAARFFEQTDQPQELTMAVTQPELQILFARLKDEDVQVFYTLVPVEYGMTGKV